MQQQTLAGCQKYGKTTRLAQFLAEMDRVVPWLELTAVVDAVVAAVEERNSYALMPSAEGLASPPLIGVVPSPQVNRNSAAFTVGDKAQQVATDDPESMFAVKSSRLTQLSNVATASVGDLHNGAHSPICV